jgi:BON domain-containing protein
MELSIPLRRRTRRQRAVTQLRRARRGVTPIPRSGSRSGRRALAPATGAAVGGALMWFFDPQSGTRRRHVLADQARARLRRGGRRAERTAGWTAAEARGMAQRATHPRSSQEPAPDDITLARKVETELFRDAAVPKGSINVNVENGRVILRGECDTDMVVRLGAEAARIPGVRTVENLLHPPGTPAPEHTPEGPDRVRERIQAGSATTGASPSAT